MNEPTAPAAEPSAPVDFAAFEASENAKATGGTWPDPAKVTTTADPELDDEPEPAAATPTVAERFGVQAPVAEPVLSKRQQKELARQQEINDAIRARAEAEQRAVTLEARLKALEATPAAEPAAKVEPKPALEPTRPKPLSKDFEDYDQFTEDLAEWKLEQREAKREADAATAREQDAVTARERDFTTRVSTWVERRDAFAATEPRFTTVAVPFLDHVRPGTPIGDVLMESEVGPQLALHLATHPAEVERIVRLAPVSALRALGKLEALFDSPSSTASAGLTAKTVSTAPAPAMTLAARSADPADPAAAALARGDFSAWEAEENRKASAAYR